MSSLSSEEMSAQRSDFGLRLSNSMAQYGPLCVGIDPHRQLLTDWGYNVDALGAELYSMRMLQAANGRAAAVKFQFSMFERYGSKGIAALERVLYAARQMGIITIVDCLHGGLPTTVSAFADVYFKPRSPLLADAITLLPYYGARSLGGVINDAPEQRSRCIHCIADLEPRGRQPADRHSSGRRVQGQNSGVRHCQHGSEVQ